MKVTLMFPDASTGALFQDLAFFAARRARTLKDHDALWKEAFEASEEKQSRFLYTILAEEWSLDVAEFNLFMFDVEAAPSWLMIELLRHRMLARDFSFEQRSKRAIHAGRISAINPFDKTTELVNYLVMADLIDDAQKVQEYLAEQKVPAERLRYAALEGSETSFVVAGNARTLHHLFDLRCSTSVGGRGTAAPEFQDLADDMYRQVRLVCPMLFPQIIA